MVVIRFLFAGILIFLTALVLGGGPSASAAASYGFDTGAPVAAHGDSLSQWRVFWSPRELDISTINYLSSPMLCGGSFACLLGIVAAVVLIVGAAFYFKAKPVDRSRIVIGAGATILILWLVYDLRETYGQLKTMEEIYQTYVRPPPENKTFFTEGDFYRFVDLCCNRIPPDGRFRFYPEPVWPYDCRIRYFLYPRRMTSRAMEKAPYHLIYNDPHIQYDPVEYRLVYRGHKGTYYVSKTGAIIAGLDEYSFVFLEEETP
jgi:hypothetical protein